MKKLTVACLLLLSCAALAAPGSTDENLAAQSAGLSADRPTNLSRTTMDGARSAPLCLVPIGDEPIGPAVEAPSKAANLPPIYIQARVKTYHKVAVGRRRMSLSSRGAVSANPSSEIVYKTVPKIQRMAVDISPIIEKYAAKYDLDPWLIRGVIEVESAFNPGVSSPVGAGGLMQLMPGTASYLGCVDRFDPEQNIAAGSRYLRMMMDRFGKEELMIAAYNAGPGNVERYGGIPPFAETRHYVVKVKRAWKAAKAAHGK